MGRKLQKNVSYILELTDNARFMVSSLSNLANNLSEGFYRIKCQYGHDDKKCEIWETKYKCCKCFLEYTNFKNNFIEYKCQCCHKNYQHKFDEKLKERFFNTHKFCNPDNNKLILLLQKCLYPYEYIDDWKKFNEVSLPEKKKDFYRHLDTEDITDADYVHPKRVCKDCEIKHLGEYHDFKAIHYC